MLVGVSPVGAAPADAADVSVGVRPDNPGSADFAQNVVTAEVGTVAEVSLTLSNTDTATLTIGSQATGWKATLNVSDDDGDGWVTVLVDTATIHRSETTFSARGGDSVTVAGTGTTPSRQVQPGSYPMTVATGGQVRNAGSLSLVDATRVCSRNGDALVDEYNRHADDIPWFLKGLLSDGEIQVVVTDERDGTYTVETAPDRRVTDLREGAASNPTAEVEADCATVTKVADADKPGAAFGEAYSNGEIRIMGSGLFDFVVVELLKLGGSIAMGLGLV